MKIIVLSCLREDKDKATKMMEKTGISWIYYLDSSDYMVGQKPSLLDGWFAIDKELIDSVMLFAFTDEACAAKMVDEVDNLNCSNSEQCYPIKAFVVPLHRWSKTIATK